jgi:hypothetical protein
VIGTIETSELAVFWNKDLSVIGIEAGPSIGAGADLAGGVPYTLVNQFYGTISANIARAVWDAFNPSLAIDSLRAKAKSAIASSLTQSQNPSGEDCTGV